MNKQLVFFFLFFSTTVTANYPMTLQEMAHHIKHHPATVEKEKALSDLKKSAIASVANIASAAAFLVIKKLWEAPRSITIPQSNGYSMKSVSDSLPVWVTTLWAVAEVAGLGYAAVKGYQGAKHLLVPDHKIVVSTTEESSKEKEQIPTHIRVKREDA